MIELRIVARDDVEAMISLEVAGAQRDLVAPNAVTLAEAAYETGSYVWGIWRDREPVGLMAMIHPREYPWDEYAWHETVDDRDAAYLWRMMIAACHQRRGYGSRAVVAAIEQARAWGTPRIAVEAADRPGGAIPFYERFGFRRTGCVRNGEVELVLHL